MRQGFPEVIYGEGKSADQIMAILQSIQERGSDVLITRVAKEKAKTILLRHPEFTYAETGRILYWKAKEAKNNTDSYIAIICAGTSDLRVAEEAAITAEVMGSKVERIYDVGVAGLHRLVDHLDVIRKAAVSVVIAGMEGALPSVVGGTRIPSRHCCSDQCRLWGEFPRSLRFAGHAKLLLQRH